VEPTSTTPEADTEAEAELIAGFLARKPGAELLFLAELDRLLRLRVRRKWRKVLGQRDDVVQGALLKLCELRETEEGRKTIRPPLAVLVKALADATARRFGRAREMVPLESWHAPTPADQDGMIRTKHLLDLAAELPLTLRTALRCHMAYELGEGPPPYIVLGLSENAARMRVSRAQAAVYRIEQEKEAEANNG
jgi:hypothetical protein